MVEFEVVYQGQVFHIKGEPDAEEIRDRVEWRTKHGADSLAICHVCPCCGRRNTEWIRNQWSICYDCEIAFNGLERFLDTSIEYEDQDAIDYVATHGEE